MPLRRTAPIQLPIRPERHRPALLSCRYTLASLTFLGAALRLHAGALDRQAFTSSPVAVPSAPRAEVVCQAIREPYLVAIGPMRLRIKPAEGQLRRPPLLPAAPAPEAKASSKATPEPAPVPALPQPSEFSPGAPPVLLPAEKPEPKEEPDKRTEPKENALTPSTGTAPDLRDSVIYFETPVGDRAQRVLTPALVPAVPAPVAPLPESRATYRIEKR